MIDFGIWDKLPENEVANMIVSGAKNIVELQPSDSIIREIGDGGKRNHILDFGCGVGRNIVGMLEHSREWDVVGYDNQSMILRAGEFILRSGVFVSNPERLRLSSDWSDVVAMAKQKRFSTIFCCLVLQHVPEPQLRWYLDQFKTIGEKLFVFGRRAIDPTNTTGYDGGNDFVSVWDVITDSGFDVVGAQRGFSDGTNGNDHHWAIFKQKKNMAPDHEKTRDRLWRRVERQQVDL